MDAFEAINKRRSVRRFLDRRPDEAAIEAVLAAAVRAPSAGNLQPWHFYVVWSADVKHRLADAALSQSHVVNAPVVIVVCVEPERSARHYGDRGRRLYCLQDAAAATENLLIAAVALGLGGCWVGAFDEEAVANILSAPEGRRPVALAPLGYPAQERSIATPRKYLDEVVTVIS